MVAMKNVTSKTHFFEVTLEQIENHEEHYVIVFTDITALQHQREAYKQMAFTDPLTKIYNRQMLDEMLKKEKSNHKREKGILSIIMFDIDHFKRVNDTYGHDVGDKVLVTLSQIVQNSLRKSDVFARWGGEEFIILLPKTQIEGAVKIAEKLRQAIETYEDDAIPKITVSFGVTEISPKDMQRSCFRRVDDALYKAKINRNEVVALLP